MQMTNRISHAVCLLLCLAATFAFTSCDKDEEYRKDTKLKIYSQFPSIVTPMDSSSIIALPDGRSECVLINSDEELHRSIPDQIANQNPSYQQVDFRTESLIMVKTLWLYQIGRIDYVVRKDGSLSRKRDKDVYTVTQAFSTDVTTLNDGQFVLSCVVTEKIPPESELVLMQSSHFI